MRLPASLASGCTRAARPPPCLPQAKLGDLATLLGTTRSDAEYQSFRQSQALREALAKAEAELVDTRKQLAEKEAELALVIGTAADKERGIVKVRRGRARAAARGRARAHSAPIQSNPIQGNPLN